MGDLELGLHSLTGELRQRKIQSVAIPALGSGLGGLEWVKVRALIESTLSRVEDVSVVVFEPRELTSPVP